MERREFLRASCYTGLASLAAGASAARAAGGEAISPRLPGETDAAYEQRLARLRALQAEREGRLRHYYELRRYAIETKAQKEGFDVFAQEAFIPALNRAGVSQVGVFYPAEDLSPIYVLLSYRSLTTFAGLTAKLMEDEEFLAMGATFLDAPAGKPAYQRMEVQLMQAFEGMLQPERPVVGPGRIFQLRTYESPSVQTGLKKIEMFNSGEIAIFRKTGLHPVFFGQTLAGEKMPNLTYMLAFDSMAESKANWSRFSSDPEWRQLRAKPEYDDKKILCGITNVYLKPASYSQI